MMSLSSGSFLIESGAARNMPLLVAAVAAGMYWLGGRSWRAGRRHGAIAPARVLRQRWKTLAFAIAVVGLPFTLQEPLDGLADRLFWAHMVEHVLLLVVLAPLFVLAAPWMRIWRGLPLGLRRRLARWAVREPTAAPLRALARTLSQPAVAWLMLAGDLVAWHLPAAYDLTLRSEAVHNVEHASFLLLALIAWGRVIDSPPFHSTLDPPRRVAFALGSMTVGWGLAVMLAFASRPWYAPYADLPHRTGGLSAIADQHIGAGVMWVPASLPWALAVFIWIYRWLPDADHIPPGEEPELVAPRPSPPPILPRPEPVIVHRPAVSRTAAHHRGSGIAQAHVLESEQLAPKPPSSPRRAGRARIAETVRRIHA